MTRLNLELTSVYNRRYLYYAGLLLTFIITLLEFSKGRHANFVVFADASKDFWQGVSPYTQEWVDRHGRYFLYTPIFSVLFTPFAFLPSWLGPFAWNIFNFSFFYKSIFDLPEQFSEHVKCKIFLFTFLILGQSLLSFQYNVTVAFIFLFAYGLMERGKFFWAIVLILISGTTKIYGIFQLGLLLCYPNLFKNIGYSIVIGLFLFLSPLLKLSIPEFLPYYQEWLGSLSSHHTTQLFDSIYYAQPLLNYLLPYYRYIQFGVLLVLIVLLIINYKNYKLWAFRAQALAVLMGWCILFSDAAEKHTYIIALAGYMLWYWSRHVHIPLDKILFWMAFVLLCVVPIDILFPKSWMNILFYTLWLHVWVFLIIWVRMLWTTFFSFSNSLSQT